MSKIPKRTINGKKYEPLWKEPNTKRKAEASAKRLRKFGVNCRVLKHKSKWNVYFRKK